MGEMTRYMDALIKDSEQLAMMIDSVPSVDNLDFIMESDALGHTVMDQLQGHESLLAVAETVTLEEVLHHVIIISLAKAILKINDIIAFYLLLVFNDIVINTSYHM
jgi:hypothetical protein